MDTALPSRTRLLALGHAELILLWRNRTAVATALLTPLSALAMFQLALPEDGDTELSREVLLATGMVGVVLLFVVYTNLVGTYAARCESLVLKRLRSGEATDAEILAAAALPSAGLGVAQIVLVGVVGAAFLDVRAPQDPPLLVLAVLLGTGIMVLLAALSAVFTRSAEMAQVTTLPLLLVSLVGSGLVIPPDAPPDALAAALRWLPLSPVMELVRIGWTGEDGRGAEAGWAEAVPALGIAVLWVAAAGYGVRRWFRWEPRR